LRDAWKFLSVNYSTFSQQKAIAYLRKAFKNIANQQGIPGGRYLMYGDL